MIASNISWKSTFCGHFKKVSWGKRWKTNFPSINKFKYTIFGLIRQRFSSFQEQEIVKYLYYRNVGISGLITFFFFWKNTWWALERNCFLSYNCLPDSCYTHGPVRKTHFFFGGGHKEILKQTFSLKYCKKIWKSVQSWFFLGVGKSKKQNT